MDLPWCFARAVLTEQTFPIKPVEKVTTCPRPGVARHYQTKRVRNWSSESRSAGRVRLLSGLFGDREGKKTFGRSVLKPPQELVTKSKAKASRKVLRLLIPNLTTQLANARDRAKLQRDCSGPRGTKSAHFLSCPLTSCCCSPSPA